MGEMLKQFQSMRSLAARGVSNSAGTFGCIGDTLPVLSTWILVCLFLVVSLPVSSLAAQQDNEHQDPEELPAARQNALLRSHFREMYPGSPTGGWNRDYRPPANDQFAESFIDRQIDHYLEHVEEQLVRLETNLAVAERLRNRILTLRIDSALKRQYKEALVGFERALKEVQNSADNLKDQLEYAFTGLAGKKKLEHTVDSASRESFYEEELRFLRRQTAEAERRIRNYLFRSVNTVDVKDLQEETMLVCLYQVEKMAKEIRRDLK